MESTKDASGTVERKIIQPVVVRTDNVAKELLRIASSHGIPPNQLDFSLLSVQTFTRLVTSDGTEWEEMNHDDLHELSHAGELLNEHFEMRQAYEIEIYSQSGSTPFADADISIGANADTTKVYITIKPGSRLAYYPEFSRDFILMINKKKLRAHVMIGLFDEPMAESVNMLRAKLQVHEVIDFGAKEVYLVAQGMEPLPTIDDRLIRHYEAKHKQVSQGDRVDYANRGYLISTVADELLIEYVKPKAGEPGRNCRGEFLRPSEPVVKNAPTFSVTDKIAVEENELHIYYRSKQNGYVTFENATYDIRTELDVSEISFKTTGSIATDLNADVSINVKEKDIFKDAIGNGMEVEVNEIRVEGNVGPNARIRSMKADIEGQTHQSSFIESERLSINIHKGKAKGKEISITRLEHGEVEGENINIKQAIGGVVRGRDVYVENLGSHVKIYASHSITINKLQGGENILVIDPMISGANLGAAKESENKIKEAKMREKELKTEIERIETLIRQNESAFADIKKRLLQYKKSGVTMPGAFVKKYKEFQSYYEKREGLKLELRQQEEKIELLKAKFNATQNDIFDARIVNNDRWRNHNEIKFMLTDPKMEVNYVPFHNSVIRTLGLKEDDGYFYIAPLDEGK